jgi:2-hydroxychromene-2-carboxylate isomerase
MTMIIYADFNCPNCYLASQRADVLMRRGRVDVDWRAVEHDPGLPLAGRGTQAGRPAWEAEVAELAGLAQPGEDVPAAPPPVISNTAAAVAAYAEAVSDGVQHDLRRHLFRAVWAEGRNLSSPHEVRNLVREIMTPPDRILPHLVSPDLPVRLLHEPDPEAVMRRSGGTISMAGDPMTTAGYRRIRRWRHEWLALPGQVILAVIDPGGGLHPGTAGLEYLASLVRATGAGNPAPGRAGGYAAVGGAWSSPPSARVS